LKKNLLVGIAFLLLTVSPTLAQDGGTHLPKLEVITPENAAQISEIARLGDGKIQQEVWSPDGQTLALSSSIGVWLYGTTAPYEADSETPPRLLDVKGSVVFSPDSKLLAAGKYDKVQLWDVASAQQLAEIPVEFSVSNVSFSPDGAILAVSNGWLDGCECTTDLWNIRDLPVEPTKLLTFNTFANWVCHSIFSPDGRYIIESLCPGKSLIWDAKTGERVVDLPIFGDLGAQATFSPDGTRLVIETSYSTADSGGFRTISLWDFQKVLSRTDLEPIWKDDRRYGLSPSPVFNSTQTIMAVYSRYEQIQFIDLNTGQELTRIRSGMVRTMGFESDDQQFYAVDNAGRIWIWDVTQALSYGLDRQALPNTIAKNVAEARITLPDFQLTVPPDPRTLGLTGHQDGIEGVTLMPDGVHLMSAASSGGGDDSGRLWDIANQEEIAIFNERGGIASLSPDGNTFASGQWSGPVQLWNASTGEQTAILEDGDRDRPVVSDLGFSPSGALLAASWATLNPSAEIETHWIRIWDSKSGEVLANLPGGTWGIKALEFSPDGLTLASGGVSDLGTDVVKLWDTHTFQERAQFDAQASVYSLAYSPDGHLLAVGGANNRVDLWNVNVSTATMQTTLPSANEGTIEKLIFSRDGRLLVGIASYNPKFPNIYLWDVENNRLLKTLHYPASSAAFGLDGRLLAIGSDDSTIRLLGIPE
jgi:WD40 repeat protein